MFLFIPSDPQAPELFDVGTCGLHIIHGAFKTGMLATSWKLDQFLRAAFNLFNESPARCVFDDVIKHPLSIFKNKTYYKIAKSVFKL